MPECISESQPDSSHHVLDKLFPAEGKFLSFNNGFRPFTQIGKQRRTNDQENIFEQGKVEENEEQPHHDLTHNKKKIQESVLLLVQPLVDPDQSREIGNRFVARHPEIVHAHGKQYHVQYAWYQDPLPQPVLGDKLVCP